MTTAPLIFTTRGNQPVADLREAVVWSRNDDEIICNVEHWIGDECVRRQCNVLKLRGESVLGQAAVIG